MNTAPVESRSERTYATQRFPVKPGGERRGSAEADGADKSPANSVTSVPSMNTTAIPFPWRKDRFGRP